MDALLLSSDKTIAFINDEAAQPNKVAATFWTGCAETDKAAARFDSLSPLHHKSHFTVKQAMAAPVTHAKDMVRMLGRIASGRVQ